MVPIRQRNRQFSPMSEKANFAKWIRGMDVVQDAVLELDKFKKSKYKGTYIDSENITRALEDQDVKFLRDLSNYFYGISGIYSRFVKYLSGILTYDWYAFPYMLKDNYNIKSVKKDTDIVLRYLDNLNIKTAFTEISLNVILDGAFYGYMINSPDKSLGTILELPIDYCRSRYKFNGMDAVEFNVKYFDEQFSDENQRIIVLSTFPKEFLKNYNAYKAGAIKVDRTDNGAWFLCDTNMAMKFSLLTNDIPLFASVIPTILELDEAKQLDMKKTMQELLKIIIQKMPIDKNGEMIFDLDEAQDMHNSACRMLGNAVNIDVLTTFADIEVADLDSSTATSSKDPLMKVERGVFNEAGISQMLFATDGNIALEKSIANDEALMFYLLGQYRNRINGIINNLFGGRTSFKVSMPELSIYNKERLAKLYKEFATAGYSKLLPAIALGQSQTDFLSLNEYEDKILNLGEVMKPVQISSTQTAKKEDSTKSNGETKKVGKPAKEDGEKSEKTMQNKESMS